MRSFSQENQASINTILHGLYYVFVDCPWLSCRLGRCCRIGMPGFCTAQLPKYRKRTEHMLYRGARTSLASPILGLQPCYWSGQLLDHSRIVVGTLGQLLPSSTDMLTTPKGLTTATARTSHHVTALEHTRISAARSRTEELPIS